jgi:hypothetical protein
MFEQISDELRSTVFGRVVARFVDVIMCAALARCDFVKPAPEAQLSNTASSIFNHQETIP